MGLGLAGAAFELRDGPYTAEVRAVGASLQRLRHDDRDLVLPFGEDQLRPAFRGAVLAPWPNRVGDGRWTWRGEEHQLPLSEPRLGHALHGLVAWAAWSAVDADERSVRLTTSVVPQPGYPFALDLVVRWALDATSGLTCELTATNAGDRPAPYGCSIHPYLVAPGGAVDAWTLHVPASRVVLVDDRLLPTDVTATPPELDFSSATGRTVGSTQLDNAFTGIAFDWQARGAVTVVDGGGVGTRLGFGTATPWVQVCTSDWPGDPGHRAGIAVEPMTCPPDAFRSGTDLVVLEPGATNRAWWTVTSVEPPSART